MLGVRRAILRAVVAGEELMVHAVALAVGAATGSFLNVVIHRLPQRQSVVAPRSHCTTCQRIIPWYDNIPVLSWFVLRGRCRQCGEPFSFRYPMVELLTAVLLLALLAKFGLSLGLLFAFYFACSLLVVTYIDLDHRIIPDRVTLPAIAVGLLLALVAPAAVRVGAVQSWALGTLVGGGVLWLVAWGYERATGREGMGGGDIKLLAMIGAFLGWQGVLVTLLLASFIGSAIGIAWMLARGADTKLAIPFGPFLALGALVALFWGEQIVAWYVGSVL
jgi:leader peptidase (prepilin peptidase)/N-methyltransferase